jgi:hypothetical protein
MLKGTDLGIPDYAVPDGPGSDKGSVDLEPVIIELLWRQVWKLFKKTIRCRGFSVFEEDMMRFR